MSGPHTASSDRCSSDTAARSRRALLGSVGVAFAGALAGCTADADHQPETKTVVDETARVEPGQYATFEFELYKPQWTTVRANLSDRSVDVKTDGPAVDVVVMTAAQYSRFQNDGTFEYVGGVSMPDMVNGEVSGTLEAGSYVALVDNTANGDATPGTDGGTSVVDLQITAEDSRD